MFMLVIAQTRRINVADLWEPSISQLAFSKVLSFACDFLSTKIDGKGNLIDFDKAIVTYIDEDGDNVNISSNEELMDSFTQTIKKQPFRPFRITVNVGGSNIDERNKQHPPPTVGDGLVRGAGRCGGRHPSMNTKRSSEHLVSLPFFIHARHTCDVCQKTPIIGTRYHATKRPDFDLCEACYKTYERKEDLGFVPEALGE